VYLIKVSLWMQTYLSSQAFHIPVRRFLSLDRSVYASQTINRRHEDFNSPRHRGSCFRRLCLANRKLSSNHVSGCNVLITACRNVQKTRWILSVATAVLRRNARLCRSLLLCRSQSQSQSQRMMLWILLGVMVVLRSDLGVFNTSNDQSRVSGVDRCFERAAILVNIRRRPERDKMRILFNRIQHVHHA
jgi:hypothetical protein